MELKCDETERMLLATVSVGLIIDTHHRQHQQSQYAKHVFQSVFASEDMEPPAGSTASIPSSLLQSIQLSVSEVATALRIPDPKKVCGPDGIPGRLLKGVSSEIAPSLCRLFNLSLSLGAVPASWKLANITPVFKKDDPSLPMNYRPISLLLILSKVFERCVFNHCYSHLTPFLYYFQHG